MTDPFDPLRSVAPGAEAPDVDVIRSRARRIRARRTAALSGAAGLAVALVAVVLVTRGPQEPSSFSVRGREPAPAASPLAEDAEPGDPEGASVPLSAPGASPERSRKAGSKADTSAGAQAARSSAAAAGAGAAGEASLLQLSLTVQPEEFKPPSHAAFKLQVCNATSRQADVPFKDAQRADFEVTKDGKLVWRWSSEQYFAQVTGTESWMPGQCREFSGKWNGSDYRGTPSAGSHDVVGILVTVPARRSGPRRVCVVACY